MDTFQRHLKNSVIAVLRLPGSADIIAAAVPTMPWLHLRVVSDALAQGPTSPPYPLLCLASQLKGHVE